VKGAPASTRPRAGGVKPPPFTIAAGDFQNDEALADAIDANGRASRAHRWALTATPRSSPI
jgi:hypothetical protein